MVNMSFVNVFHFNVWLGLSFAGWEDSEVLSQIKHQELIFCIPENAGLHKQYLILMSKHIKVEEKKLKKKNKPVCNIWSFMTF